MRIKLVFGEPEGKRSLRRPRLRWEDNIVMDLTEETERAVVNTILNLGSP
jgi:hypothetical protein